MDPGSRAVLPILTPNHAMLPADDSSATHNSVPSAAGEYALMGISDPWPVMAHQHLFPVKTVTLSRGYESGGRDSMQEARKIHINNLPVEVLGMVIEAHALIEWRAPIIDGSVARHWRGAALSCPRVWSHIVLEDDSMNEAGVDLWLGRAGATAILQPKIGTFRTTGATGILLNQSHRFRALSYRGVLPVLYPISFPKLQHLTIFALGDGCLDSINGGQPFPSLRTIRLDGFDSLKFNLKSASNFGSLQYLYFHDINGPWQPIVRECADSLVTLMLEACHGPTQQSPIHLPRLQTLSLRRVSGLRLVQLNTPVLVGFHEGYSQGLRNVQGSESLLYTTVTEYGSYRRDTGLNDLIPFPNISTLALREIYQTVLKILQMLGSTNGCLPALRMIEIRDNVRRPFCEEQYIKMEELVDLLRASRLNPIEVIYTETRSMPIAPMYFAQVCVMAIFRPPVRLQVDRIRLPLASRSQDSECNCTSLGVVLRHPIQAHCPRPSLQHPTLHLLGRYQRNRVVRLGWNERLGTLGTPYDWYLIVPVVLHNIYPIV
jgi:hypothetical protein